MPITYVGSNVQDSAGALNLTFDVSATGAIQGDLMIAAVKQSENTTQRTWDDDGGGGNGWTRLTYNRTTGGRDQETAIYYKIHSGSESDPTFTWATGITSEPMSGFLEVYRGVDPNTPILDWAFLTAQNDANPPNASVNFVGTNAAVIAIHFATHDDISSPAPPTGYIMRDQVWSGTANDHRNGFFADLLGLTNSGPYTPPDWQHSVLNTTPEYHCYTLVLQEIQPIGVLTYSSERQYGQSDAITGFGFEASQGTGKVELWSDLAGTIKEAQTVNSWADTAINYTLSQGALSNDATVYLVITNDSGDESSPVAVSVGLKPYDVIIADENPDHSWPFNNDGYADVAGSSPFTAVIHGGGGSFQADPICEASTHSWEVTSGVKREAANTPFMNTSTTTNRLMGGWIRLDGISKTFSCIYEEGGGVNNLAFFLGVGNILTAQLADTGDDNVQAYSNFKLEPNRDYHIMFQFTYTESVKEFRLWVDGELQDVTFGNPLTSTDLDAHSGDITMGGTGGALEVFGTNVDFATQDGTHYARWATWSVYKAPEVILRLARRGALPDVVIASDTPANMQIALDSLADTVRPNSALCIRVEAPTGGGDLELVADNIQFDPFAAVQVEWRGAGTLTWVNSNGSNLVDEKVYNTVGGTTVIAANVPVEISALDIATENPIQNARVLVLAESGGSLPVDTVILNDLTDVSGQAMINIRNAGDQPISYRVREGSTYKEAIGVGVVSSNGFAATAQLEAD